MLLNFFYTIVKYLSLRYDFCDGSTEDTARGKRTYPLNVSFFREKFEKMKNDVTVQDEERTMKLEKEKDGVRIFFQL